MPIISKPPITLVSTKFTNLHTGMETFGFRMYDDYGMTYSNTMTEEEAMLPPSELLKLVFTQHNNDVVDDMRTFVEADGIEVNDEFIEGAEVTIILVE
jgi:hypothetical protein